jgi:GNAT superfamily N-acetyltransferase
MQNIQEYHRDNFTISTDPTRLDIAVIHNFLTTGSYWAQNRPLEVVQRSIENSLNFGVYCDGRQVGFARVVTDYATFGWLCDVFILPDERTAGLGKWLVECIINHPDIKPIRRLLLATRDAHELYRRYGGFTSLANPDRWMEKTDPNR